MRATEPQRRLILLAPLSGWSTPLDEIPDPVFAGRMLGDGLAVDPTSATLQAPCDGEVIALPESRHAVTLCGDSGVEILMHIGIDTVGLGGEGFEAHVTLGARVVAGERLITFDLDLIARRAKSLLTPILVMEGCGFAVVRRIENREIAAGDVLMELAAAGVGQRPIEAAQAASTVARRLRVPLEHGFHARPAAQLGNALKGFQAEIRVVVHDREANARSAVALMALGVKKGDEIEIRATGTDAAAAVQAAETLIFTLREGPTGTVPATRAAASSTARPQAVRAAASVPVREGPPPPGTTLRGVTASRGLAIGPLAHLSISEIEVVEAGAGAARESEQLSLARATVRQRLRQTSELGTGASREIAEAHLALLDDPELSERAQAAMTRGKSAAFAWREAVRASVEVLRALDDPRMRERADDLIDLERQVLLALSGDAATGAHDLPAGAILAAEELLPSQLVGLDASRLGGICLAGGGATSHVSILAAAMGVPAVVALGPAVQRIAEGTTVILDADAGVLQIDPGAEPLSAAGHRLELATERRAKELAAAQRECHTADGVRIEVLANIGSLAEAEAAIRNGAEGCGLLRTEFLFLERQTPPTEAEQCAEYQQLAQALGGRPMTIRTLDAGGDKPIPYLPLPREENPALGLRGVRTSLWRPELLRAQLRAVLGVRPYGQCRIMLPMITDAGEVRSVRTLVEEASREIGRRERIELGVMIETPASALTADRLAEEVDFFSIGTNDLTQYTLAMDRGHAELAARLDALHPAVLRLIARTAEAAHARGRRVAVCGGLASDPAAAPILIGLGVHELSAVPSVVPELKALIEALTIEDCQRLARRALEQDSAAAVRSLKLEPAARANASVSVSH